MAESAFPTHAAAFERKRTDVRSRLFFVSASVVMLLVVFAGFAPSLYLRPLFHPRPIPAYLYVHGAMMTAWYLLFVVQSTLIATHRPTLHRRFGYLGIALALAVVLFALYVNLNFVPRLVAARFVDPRHIPPDFQRIVVSGVVGVGVLAALVTLALIWRHRAGLHRRLMFYAYLGGVAAAITADRPLGAAIASILPRWVELTEVTFLVGMLALALHDWHAERRIHAATLFGGLALLLMFPFANTLVGTSFSEWIVGSH